MIYNKGITLNCSFIVIHSICLFANVPLSVKDPPSNIEL